jgi:nitroreductase
MLKNLVIKNRSYRRFYQEKSISRQTLLELVDLARVTPASKNMQPLKYFLSFEEDTNRKIFPHLAWARHLKDWEGPPEGERPSAYIIILEDTTIGENFQRDQGIVALTIMLGAVEMGLGGCIIASVKREEVSKALQLNQQFKIALVLALGFPKETVVLEELLEENETHYWRDGNQVHHVPKRRLDDIVL